MHCAGNLAVIRITCVSGRFAGISESEYESMEALDKQV
jgi:hypothetical protein